MLKASLEIPFEANKEAEIVYNTLRVDQEPARGRSSKELILKDNILIVEMQSETAGKLRASMTSFTEYLILVLKTVARFGLSNEIK